MTVRNSIIIPADSALLTDIEGSYYSPNRVDTVFQNVYYRYREYNYFDFRLAEESPARGIGTQTAADTYPLDRNGISRINQPDAGCYQYVQ